MKSLNFAMPLDFVVTFHRLCKISKAANLLNYFFASGRIFGDSANEE